MQLKSLLFLILVPILIAGCGGGGSANNPHGVSQVAASQTCASATCHGTQVSPVTGTLIADEWRGSSHMTQNAAGCADCHEPDAGHPNLCNKCHGGGGFAVTREADAAGKCGKCHGLSFPEDPMMALAPQHYGYSSARALPGTPRASYVSAQYQGRCRACHNSHNNNVTPQHREYAKSLHGDPQGVAWTHYDFKQDNRAACNRCHTSTGYINFVTSGFTVATKGFSTGDASREMVACDACHASYDFKNSIRKVAAFTAPYKGYDGNPATFPGVGASDLCTPCHSGREGGQAINAIAEAKFTDTGFVNSHYMASSGLMYMQNGFINFTSLTAPIVVGSTISSYGRTLSPDNLTTPGGMVGGQSSTHRKLGTSRVTGDSHNRAFFVPGVADQNGPCVTCHLNVNGTPQRPGSGHSLKINANAYRQLCVNCHDSEGTHEEVVQLTAENFQSEFLKPQAEAFEDSLELLKELLLQKYQISFDELEHPYFYDEALPLKDGKKQALRDWTRGGKVNGRKLMGACYNYNLLTRDAAAYAHARSYSRRLIYDSIDFLDDGIMNLSVSASAVSLGLTHPDGKAVFVKDSKAYNVAAGGGITTIFGTTTDAMLYLIGWNRTTGDWNATERP
jgi:hypothetical protein